MFSKSIAARLSIASVGLSYLFAQSCDFESEDVTRLAGIEPMPSLGAANLPTNADGQVILAKVGQYEMILGPAVQTPLAAAAACIDWLSRCLITSASFDECVASVARCQTPEPWNEVTACCPGQCVDAYTDLVASGVTELAAWLAVWGTAHRCFPGFDDLPMTAN